MALYGTQTTINYVAWDTSANAGKTGDVANHTLRWIKDGTSAAPTNSPAEVDATNAPGVYKVTLTAAECQAVFGTLAGKSSTGNVSIMPVSIAFDGATILADLRKIHGTDLTEVDGQLAGRFVDFFNQDSAGYNVKTPLASFKAAGFSTHDAAAVKTAMEADGSKLDHLWEMTEDDLGVRRLTANALEQAPDTTTGLTLHGDYDAAKTAAQPGDEMDLVDAPNAAAVSAIQSGLSTHNAAAVWAVADRQLTAFSFTVGANLTQIQGHTLAGTGTWIADGFEHYFHVETPAKTMNDVGGGSGSGLTAQQTRDAMKLTPTAGDPAAGSVDAHLDSIQAKTDTLGVGNITASSPVASDGQFATVVRGDDYLLADGRRLEWASTGWPDLTGATITLTFRDVLTDVADLSTAGSVISSGGDSQTVGVELTAAETEALTPGTCRYKFDVQATLAGGSVVTLVRGLVTVFEDQTR